MTPADLALLARPEGDRAEGDRAEGDRAEGDRAEGDRADRAEVVVEVVGADGPGCAALHVRFGGEWLGDLLLASAGDRARVVDALRAGAVTVVTGG
jgi:hypothetical protein